MIKFYALLILAYFASNTNCVAQNASMNRISIESGSVIGGVVGISYERTLFKKFAVFGGVSALIDSNDEPFGFGIGLRLIPKENLSGFILSFSYGTGGVSVEVAGQGRDYLKGFILLGGYRFGIKQILDIELGAGIQFTTEESSSSTGPLVITVNEVKPTIALNVGIGYHF